ncbi:MAG: ATP-binding protein [Firmicutes bacterium]|nr:ATP-binding protein [Bacillota bacterium]
MFRSIQTKIVAIFILVLLSIVTVLGAFLTTNIVRFYNREFSVMMKQVFSGSLVSEIEKRASSDGVSGIAGIVGSYIGPLGIDTYRFYSILDANTGNVLITSDETKSRSLEKSDNIIMAMTGKTGDIVNTEKRYMDYAVPISTNGALSYIVYIKDTKNEINSITRNVIFILLEALAFAIAIAVILGYFFSKTITKPIRNLTKNAERIAMGSFDKVDIIDSKDEIGILSNTFSYMSSTLHDTIEEVNSEKTKVETILQNMTDGILAFNLSGGLIHINSKAKDILNRKFYDDITFDNFFKEIGVNVSMGEFLYMKSSAPIERQTTVSGKVIHFTFATFSIENKIGGILVVMHDITSQQKLELSRREFVANVSHELRTPITAIKSYAETLIDTPQSDVVIRNRFLEVIVKEADRMARIIKDLLILSKLDEGQFELKPFEKIDLGLFIDGIVEKMFFSAKAKHQTLQYKKIDDVPYIISDADKLEQVILNIISNAVKYTPDGGIIEIYTGKGYKTVYIKVRDNGIGIPEENLPRIFERFYRVDKARSRETGGTGLGLAIAKQIMDQLGGSIKITSTYGKGTEVTVVIPA